MVLVVERDDGFSFIVGKIVVNFIVDEYVCWIGDCVSVRENLCFFL